MSEGHAGVRQVPRDYYSATERADTKRHIGLGGVERKSGFSWDAF